MPSEHDIELAHHLPSIVPMPFEHGFELAPLSFVKLCTSPLPGEERTSLRVNLPYFSSVEAKEHSQLYHAMISWKNSAMIFSVVPLGSCLRQPSWGKPR